MCFPFSSSFNTRALTLPASDKGGSLAIIFAALSVDEIFSAWRTTYTLWEHESNAREMAENNRKLATFIGFVG